jgi:uncharacterized YigZ family protein
MKDSYYTIRQVSSGIFKEKGSRFLSFAIPIRSELEALEHIDRLKKEYYDARHHCYAYVLGREGYHRVHDAGEPRHTAGDPIYNQIRSKERSDILVVVVRYFGGTKLGKSGLINAYKKAAEDALSKSIPTERIIYRALEVKFRYEGLDDIMRLIDQHNLQIVQQSYETEAKVVLQIRESAMDQIIITLSALSCVTRLQESSG